MPEFTGVLDDLNVRACRVKGGAPQSWCSLRIVLKGSDEEAQTVYEALKPLFQKRVKVSISAEQTSIPE